MLPVGKHHGIIVAALPLKAYLIMENKSQSNEPFKQAQQGTGSSEQTGRERTEQLHKITHVDENQRQDIADQIGEDSSRVAGLDELGAFSGRDDLSGGSGDDMESQSSGQPTDKF